MLRHAWKELLLLTNSANEMTLPSCQVIPCGATVYVCAIECIEVRKKTRYMHVLEFHLHACALVMSLYNSSLD